MSAISNTLLLGSIDREAATAKAIKAAVAQTEDMYTMVTREDNPGDLTGTVNGALAASNCDAKVQGCTALYNLFSDWVSFLNTRAVDASSDGIADLLADRYLRVPKSWCDYCIADAAYDGARLFPDTEVSFGTFLYGGVFAAGSNLSTDVDYCWGVIEVGTGGIGGVDWVLAVDVTYADDSVGVEAVTITNGSLAGVQFDIGAAAPSALVKTGQAVIGIAVTAPFIAGQYVLLVDDQYPALLTANASSAQKIIYVDPTQIGGFRTGDPVTVRDGSANENLTIEDIDYELGKITMTTALGNSYTTAANAFVYLQAPIAGREGWQECHPVASKVTDTSITVTGNLQHTYYTGAKVIRMIKDVTDIVTTSGGASAEDVIAKSKTERTLTQ
jgi:hypothetical protein